MDAKTLQDAMGISAEVAARWTAPLQRACEEADISTPRRLVDFLAQLGHESNGLRWVEEIWGPTKAQAGYEGRTDLGNVEPGDGYRYRGRGPIQLTGRLNYRAASMGLGLDLEGHPELVLEPDVGARAAAWYWQTRRLNFFCDRGDFIGLTRAINGGLNGLVDRQERRARAARILLPSAA
jgi:putative chitinase